MEIRTLFFDLGGVCLTNGWDHVQRQQVAAQLGFDYEAFDARHRQVIDSLERGQLSLEAYLQWTLFYEPRQFTPAEAQSAIFALSAPFEPTLALVRQLRASHRYTLATLNNESRELNRFRIEHFGLRALFTMFVSSCYLNLIKPQPEMYRRALDLVQCDPAECVFVDDRPMNCEVAQILGMQAIQFTSAAQLSADLARLGVAVEAPHEQL